MNPFKFFQQLKTASFDRSLLSSSLDNSHKLMEKSVIPMYRDAGKLLRGRKYAAGTVSNFEGLMSAHLPALRNKNLFEATEIVFIHVCDRVDEVQELVLSELARDVLKEQLTFRRASLLQYVQAVDFCSHYALRALQRIMADETNATIKEFDADHTPPPAFNPAEEAWLNDNQEAYFKFLGVLIRPDVIKTIQEAPDVLIDPRREREALTTLGADKVDPLRMNFISANWNPVYWFRMRHAEISVAHHHRNMELRRVLELRLLELKQAQAGKQDAKLQGQIEYQEGRLQRLQFEISKFEEKYG